MTVMNLQDETERGPGPVPTGDTFVHVATKRGGLKATSRDFLDWTLPRPPDILIAMADESMNITTSKLHKSIVRSIAWVSEIAIEAKVSCFLNARLERVLTLVPFLPESDECLCPTHRIDEYCR